VLHSAEALVQTRSFNAFCYADIARAVGIRKASLHHHFAAKAALGVALVARYCSAFLAPPCNDTLVGRLQVAASCVTQVMSFCGPLGHGASRSSEYGLLLQSRIMVSLSLWSQQSRRHHRSPRQPLRDLLSL
jgi:AcrR family transcriptional regulator